MDFVAPATKGEALATLAELGPDATVLAGGTDVMVQYLRDEITPRCLLYIGKLDELREAEADSDAITLGALTTHRRLAMDPKFADRLTAVSEAAATVGGWQTQSVGTVGGNICNASPAADLSAPLLVADAVVNLESAAGKRSISYEDFIVGRRATLRDSTELVTSLTVVPQSSRTGETYLKVGRRGAMEVALVGLAVRLTLDEVGRVADVAIGVCSVSPIPYRATDSEEVITGTKLEAEAIKEAADLLTGSATPITDFRADASYRKRVLGPLLERGLSIAAQRAAG